MDLHGLARGLITSVNPETAGGLRVSTGYTTSASGKRTPTYATSVPVMIQVQDLSQRDILHLDSLNIQGSQKVLYVGGKVEGLSRPDQKGGDLVDLPDGTWLVTAVLEQWPDWAKVAVTRQMGG